MTATVKRKHISPDGLPLIHWCHLQEEVEGQVIDISNQIPGGGEFDGAKKGLKELKNVGQMVVQKVSYRWLDRWMDWWVGECIQNQGSYSRCECFPTSVGCACYLASSMYLIINVCVCCSADAHAERQV